MRRCYQRKRLLQQNGFQKRANIAMYRRKGRSREEEAGLQMLQLRRQGHVRLGHQAKVCLLEEAVPQCECVRLY
ncbi:hypothetical protein PMIN01_05836 [Paraphaeosphaeria minitans]|uniref:Uncharacterized protein n=1 Tax=Paraphaeosphaeria minitans TaxID=565426 RepID=A0A9P6GHV6_9PLEO|nr:hypothetical protein PMIN01_05836 [Paraphaeosphaeria minitans]